ncbi:type II secretion system protein GspL [Paraconexibacter antarcticus]|uniref:Type II secretion system protein GspL n=1 Tax=Paraconexibacter antarcticus TaxID=2949664 RepID=A0ABY5DP33_9ACTN|nr:type II secretion system protein GspL [Paraconexibacter antarcticus]UTI62552.1 type II secretion system protein GspL [Paraconexibacter antarcticus]
MAKRSTHITGLEIDPSAITAAAVGTDGKLSVSSAAYALLEPGIIRDGEVQDVAALSQALRSLFDDHRELDKRVRVGIANQRIVLRVIELPPIKDEKQLAQAVRFLAQDQIPMPLDSAVLDFRPLDIVDTPDGPRQRVAVVAARRDMIDRVLDAVRGAGLRIEGIDLAAFGMVRALHHHGLPGETVVYLSVGGVTNLAVAQGTTCTFTRVIGGGLDGLAVELAERRALTLEHAGGWLTHVGLEEPCELVTGYADDGAIIEDARAILIDGVRRIAGEVRNSVDFHQGNGIDGGVQRCVLTGPAVAVPGFAAALAADLGLPVDAGDLRVPPGLEAGRLAVAAGLAVEEALVA